MTINQMTYKQGHTLAAFIATIRPDWDTPGIEAALAQARSLAPAPDVAIAAIKAAKDTKNRTPAIIPLEGTHWRNSDTTPRYVQPGKDETCSTCYQREDICRTRWAGDHDFIPITRAAEGRSLSPAEVRAELEATLATLCTHHVNRSRWKCEPCDQADKPAPKELTA